METAAWQWAREEFGDAELGDRRRVGRLVRLAASAAVNPAGTVTSVMETSAEREGAFRLLESQHVTSAAVASASHAATVRRCKTEPMVYVPVDGSSLSLTDRVCGRDVGTVGNWSQGGRGLQVVSALAVSAQGSPIGVCGQRYWARTQRAAPRRKKCRQLSLEKENRHGLDLVREVRTRFAEQAPEVQLWFQFDRGFDCWPVLQLGADQGLRMTIRAAQNRCVRASKTDKKNFLFSCMQRAPRLGLHEVSLPARNGRPARVAVLEIRARTVSLELRVSRHRCQYVTMTAVSAREVGRRKPLHWRLLTTVAVESLQDAIAVLDAYATRWRIEDFHRAWKSGICNVEDTQLRGRDTILKWATILAAVAARATKLTYLARETPDVPATQELSRWEIDATIALLRPKDIKLGATPTLAQAVGWIADLGGFAGKYSGRPPGPTVIARGLAKVEVAAEVLKNSREM